MKQTNFDLYLAGKLRDAAFADRFAEAGEAWDVALQLVQLREEAGLSQKLLAEKLGTTQQQVSRLESPGYEGHSLRMLRRYAQALGARVRVVIESDRPSGRAPAAARPQRPRFDAPATGDRSDSVREPSAPYAPTARRASPKRKPPAPRKRKTAG